MIAIDLLTKFGLDYIRLERQCGDYYTYRAWNSPIIQHSGSPKIVKRGKVRIPA